VSPNRTGLGSGDAPTSAPSTDRVMRSSSQVAVTM
jgi:hypothetical protein